MSQRFCRPSSFLYAGHNKTHRCVQCDVPAFSIDAVAEHAFALLLAATRRLLHGRESLLNASWRSGLTLVFAGVTLIVS
jgi:lactate dehydrogenase-like 2-hydroxyacid dehydrogenase